MKHHYFLFIILISLSSCMRFANRIAYGPGGKPDSSIPQVVGQAKGVIGDVVQTKQAIDQYKKQVKGKNGEKRRIGTLLCNNRSSRSNQNRHNSHNSQVINLCS